MVGYKDSLYVFGGSNGEITLNDFWKFSFTTKKWENLSTDKSPSVIISFILAASRTFNANL